MRNAMDRWCWGAFAAVVLTAPGASAQVLGLTWDDGKIRVAAPMFHFVEGPIVERLKSGIPAAFTVSVTVSTDSRKSILKQASERFVFSYDLWEEKFATALPSRRLGPVSHRTSGAAEAWCLDQLSITASDLPSKKPLWFSLEVKAVERPQDGDTSMPTSLSSMIDLFGRNRPKETRRWQAEAGPVELDQIPKSSGKRSALMEAEPSFGAAEHTALGLE